MTDTPQWQGHSSGPFPHGAAGPQSPYGPQSSQAVPAPGGFQGGAGWQIPPGAGGFPTQPVMQKPAQAPYLPAGAPASYQAGPAYPAAPDGGAPTRGRRTASAQGPRPKARRSPPPPHARDLERSPHNPGSQPAGCTTQHRAPEHLGCEPRPSDGSPPNRRADHADHNDQATRSSSR